MSLSRRSFFAGLAAAVAAPAIVRAESLMPVKVWRPEWKVITLERVEALYRGLPFLDGPLEHVARLTLADLLSTEHAKAQARARLDTIRQYRERAAR